MANQLIESMTVAWEPERYTDTHREQVLELIERKAAGEDVTSAPEGERQAGDVVDLVAALEASLAAAREGGGLRRVGLRREVAGTRTTVRVGERELSVSNLDKVLYPATGTTKAEVLRYYVDVAEVMLPHLAGRPVTLKRFPDGVESEGFFEKRCPPHAPDWIGRVQLGREGREKVVDHCDLAEVAALAWAANLGALELHVTMGAAPDTTVPTAVVFDLDPGAPADVRTCAEVALLVREVLDGLGLRSFPKTSGSKGLQVYVPVHDPELTYARTRGSRRRSRRCSRTGTRTWSSPSRTRRSGPARCSSTGTRTTSPRRRCAPTLCAHGRARRRRRRSAGTRSRRPSGPRRARWCSTSTTYAHASAGRGPVRRGGHPPPGPAAYRRRGVSLDLTALVRAVALTGLPAQVGERRDGGGPPAAPKVTPLLDQPLPPGTWSDLLAVVHSGRLVGFLAAAIEAGALPVTDDQWEEVNRLHLDGSAGGSGSSSASSSSTTCSRRPASRWWC
jgi:DNA ligase D-like protein (predicted polymerase)